MGLWQPCNVVKTVESWLGLKGFPLSKVSVMLLFYIWRASCARDYTFCTGKAAVQMGVPDVEEQMPAL